MSDEDARKFCDDELGKIVLHARDGLRMRSCKTPPHMHVKLKLVVSLEVVAT